MAHAETGLASPLRNGAAAPLWADGQFHILEMQTGTPEGHAAAAAQPAAAATKPADGSGAAPQPSSILKVLPSLRSMPAG